MQKNKMDLPTQVQITLYLGSQCNLYCHREASDGEGGISEEFLAKLKRNPPRAIKFMGGEPLLYMKEIRKVVEAVPQAKFAVSTNGIGIEKHLDYFREHYFQICISYDGAERDLRGYDPFTDLLDYPDLAVSTTLYHGNTDLGAIMVKFREKEKVIGRNLSFFPHLMHVTNETNRKYALTREDYPSWNSTRSMWGCICPGSGGSASGTSGMKDFTKPWNGAGRFSTFTEKPTAATGPSGRWMPKGRLIPACISGKRN